MRIVNWDGIKDNPPPCMKVSPIAMIPRKSRKFRAILDLSFAIKLECGRILPSVNDALVINQMGHVLTRIIHAFTQADPDATILQAKWDTSGGFWHLDYEEGQEWNFAYILTQKEGQPIKMVVPTSLHMGCIESPTYFCVASETGQDVTTQYIEAPMGTLRTHKFLQHAMTGDNYKALPRSCNDDKL